MTADSTKLVEISSSAAPALSAADTLSGYTVLGQIRANRFTVGGVGEFFALAPTNHALGASAGLLPDG